MRKSGGDEVVPRVRRDRSTFSFEVTAALILSTILSGGIRLGCTPSGRGIAFLPSDTNTHAEPAPPYILGGLIPKTMEHAQLLEESFPTCFSQAISLTWPAFRCTLAPCADPRSFRCRQDTGLSRLLLHTSVVAAQHLVTGAGKAPAEVRRASDAAQHTRNRLSSGRPAADRDNGTDGLIRPHEYNPSRAPFRSPEQTRPRLLFRILGSSLSVRFSRRRRHNSSRSRRQSIRETACTQTGLLHPRTNRLL